MHAATAFKIFLRPQNNFLAHLSDNHYRFFRRTVISIVLATDMAAHADLVNVRLQYTCCKEGLKSNTGQGCLIRSSVLTKLDLNKKIFSFQGHAQQTAYLYEEEISNTCYASYTGLFRWHQDVGQKSAGLASREEDPGHADGGALCRHSKPCQTPPFQPAVGGQSFA